MSRSIQNSFYAFLTLLLSLSFVSAQECTLDIGGKNSEMVVSIFQLNEEQQAVMQSLRGELEITIKTAEDDIQKLFETHPQGTEAELISLSDKYKALKEKMVMASWESDKKLLQTFNTKQYDRYLSLCHEAVRNPIQITPVNYSNTSTPE